MANVPSRKVALIGASGLVGKHVLAALLSPTFRSSYSDVIILRRKDSKALDGDIRGASVRLFDEDRVEDVLQDVDVLICTIGTSGYAFRDKLIYAIAKSPVKVYIPSEFGVDHTVHDFEHNEWSHKKVHFELTQEVIPHVQVLRIYVGLFLEESIGPWFGFYTAEDRYEAVGSADAPVSYTSLQDTGKVVAQVARTRMVPILGCLHIGGDTSSMRQIADTMTKAGAGQIKVEEIALEPWKASAISEGTKDPSKCLRFLMGAGQIHHMSEVLGNDNEIVNPGETIWKWRRMSDYAKETGGRPWKDFGTGAT